MASDGRAESAAGPPVVSRPLLLLDYDGVLAPIVAEPNQAHPHPRVPALLAQLLSRHPVRVITGRSVADLARLLPLEGLTAVGVHGMEEGPLDGSREVTSRLGEAEAKLLDRVRSSLPTEPWLRVEDKAAALALHYRQATDEEAAKERLAEWARDLPAGLETVWGKKVVEVRPEGFDKGRAAGELAAAHPDRQPVMIGDDTTDEDAFRALSGHAGAVTVKVGEGETAARYRLPDMEAAVAYLESYLSTY